MSYNPFSHLPSDENHQLICKDHNRFLSNCYLEHITDPINSTKIHFLCPECKIESGQHSVFPLNSQYYEEANSYVLSISNTSYPSLEILSEGTKPPVDIMNCQLEHALFQINSIGDIPSGYSPRCLAYIPDKKLLVACSNNGILHVWSFKETIQPLASLSVECDTQSLFGPKIEFMKYIDMEEAGKRLVVGVENDVHFYNLHGEEPKLVNTIKCQWGVLDLAYMNQSKRLITVEKQNTLEVWNPEDLSARETINVESFFGIKEQIVTIFYIKESDTLACETAEGVYLVNEERKAGDKEALPHYEYQAKRGYGLGYLPKSNLLALMTKETGVCLLDAQTLTEKFEYPGFKPFAQTPGFIFKTNEDESQIICNTNSNHLQICHQTSSAVLYLGDMLKRSGGIEILHDQNRFVVADQNLDLILVFKSNVQDDPRFHIVPTNNIRIELLASDVSETSKSIHLEEEIQITTSSRVIDSKEFWKDVEEYIEIEVEEGEIVSEDDIEKEKPSVQKVKRGGKALFSKKPLKVVKRTHRQKVAISLKPKETKRQTQIREKTQIQNTLRNTILKKPSQVQKRKLPQRETRESRKKESKKNLSRQKEKQLLIKRQSLSPSKNSYWEAEGVRESRRGDNSRINHKSQFMEIEEEHKKKERVSKKQGKISFSFMLPKKFTKKRSEEDEEERESDEEESEENEPSEPSESSEESEEREEEEENEYNFVRKKVNSKDRQKTRNQLTRQDSNINSKQISIKLPFRRVISLEGGESDEEVNKETTKRKTQAKGKISSPKKDEKRNRSQSKTKSPSRITRKNSITQTIEASKNFLKSKSKGRAKSRTGSRNL